MDHKIEVVSESGTKNGHWRSASEMSLPYVVLIDGVPLRAKNGQLRRFSWGESARKAAEKINQTH